MSSERQPPAPSDATVLLLNRAVVVMESVRTAAHDLNNTIQLISGSAEMLEATAELPSRARARIDVIQRQAARVRDIMERVAALARRESAAAARTVDVAAAVTNALEMRAQEHARAAIVATADLRAAGPCLIRGNPRHILQMLLSLLLNAEEAVAGQAGGGTIRVALACDETTIEIRVADSGPGLPADAGDPFAPFATSRPPGGAGLGLAAVRIVAELYGGTVDIGAGPLGGAEAVVRLPNLPPDARRS